MIVPVECLENRIMKIIKSAIFGSLNCAIQLWYPYYRNSELVYSHAIILFSYRHGSSVLQSEVGCDPVLAVLFFPYF